MRAPRAADESFRSEGRSVRRDIAGRRHFGAAPRKKHACAKGLQKSQGQFGVVGYFERLVRLKTKRSRNDER